MRPPLCPRAERPAPLSTAQARLWYLQQSRPPSAEYDLQLALHLHGALDVLALVTAVGAVLRRHEPLRTVVASVGGRPVQEVRPAEAVPMELSPAPGPGSPDERATAVAADELRTVFDLGARPPSRVRIAATGPQSTVLVLTMHHMAFDGWSTQILLSELQRTYTAAASGRLPDLPDLEVSYSDYAWWEHDRDPEQDAALVAYWATELDGAPVLPLPGPDGVGGPSGSIRTPITATTADRIRALAAAERTTPFVVALAAWWAMLARAFGRDDVVVGTPVAGRAEPALDPLVGCFVNTVCLRGRIDPTASFRSLVAAARASVASAVAHQALPFEELVRRLRPERSAGRNPLFRAFCSAVDGIPELPNLPGLDVEFVAPAAGPSRFDLNATFLFDREEPLVQLDHSLVALSRAEAAELADGLGVLLDWAAAGPDRPVGRLRTTRPAARRSAPAGAGL